jgi:UDP-3-O-[3-hydroxymyristoyl] glucosamine N-acyltransferase
MKRSAAELAEAIGAKLEGDGAVEVRGVAAPERAGPHDLIYVEAAKYAERAAGSAALCVIAGEGVEGAGKTVLRHRSAKVAFAKAAALLVEKTAIAGAGIHPTAIVAPLSRIAATVSIGPYAVIGEDVHIGEGTQIGAHCVIGAGCFVGANCRFHPRVLCMAACALGTAWRFTRGRCSGRMGSGSRLGMVAIGNFRRRDWWRLAMTWRLGRIPRSIAAHSTTRRSARA